MDSRARRAVLSGGGWDQSHVGFVDGPRGRGGRVVFVEYSTSGQGIFYVLPCVDRRRVRRVPQLRSVSSVCLLRTRDDSEILPDRDLGFDEQGVRRDETGALLIRRQRTGAGGCDRRLRGGGREHVRSTRT